MHHLLGDVLLTHNVNNPGTGAEGMTAEQVVRAAIVRQRQACPDITHLGLKISNKACQNIWRIVRGGDIAAHLDSSARWLIRNRIQHMGTIGKEAGSK